MKTPNKPAQGHQNIVTPTANEVDQTVDQNVFGEILAQPAELPPWGEGDPRDIKTQARALRRIIQKRLDGQNGGSFKLWTRASDDLLLDELYRMGLTTVRKKDLHDILLFIGFQKGIGLEKGRRIFKSRRPLAISQSQFIQEQLEAARKAAVPALIVSTKRLSPTELPPIREEVALWDYKPIRDLDFYPLTLSGQRTMVDMDLDDASLVLAWLRSWWDAEGRTLYPNPPYALLLVEGTMINGYRDELWQVWLKNLATTCGFPVRVCHQVEGGSPEPFELSPVFSLCSFYSSSWRGQRPGGFKTTIWLDGAFKKLVDPQTTIWVDHAGFDFGREAHPRALRRVVFRPLEVNQEINYEVLS